MTCTTSEWSLSFYLFLCRGRKANFLLFSVTVEVDRIAARVHQLGH